MLHNNQMQSFNELAIYEHVKNHDLVAIKAHIVHLKEMHKDSHPSLQRWLGDHYTAIIPGAVREAINLGYIDIVELFLNEGIDANETAHQSREDKGYLPLLYFAVAANQLEIVELLLARGAVAKSKNPNDDSYDMPMECAIEHNMTEIAIRLLEKGAKANDRVGDEYYLSHAAKHKNEKLVDALIAHGADILGAIHVSNNNYRDKLAKLYRKGTPQEIKDCKQDYYNVISILLDRAHGIDFPEREELNAFRGMGLGFIEGLDITGFNFRRMAVDGEFVTRKMLKAYKPAAGINATLINKKDVEEIEDSTRRTALITRESIYDKNHPHLVVDRENDIVNVGSLARVTQRNDVAAVEFYLKDCGVNPNQKDKGFYSQKQRPILIATAAGNLEMVKLFAEHNEIEPESIVAANKLAGRKNHTAIVQYLSTLQDVNAQDGDGSTLMHSAAYQGDYLAVARLIEKGADINIQNQSKYSAVDYAVFTPEEKSETEIEQRTKILRLLLNQKPKIEILMHALQLTVEVGGARSASMILEALPEVKPNRMITSYDHELNLETTKYIPWYVDLVFKAIRSKNTIAVLAVLKKYGANFNCHAPDSDDTVLTSAIKQLPSFSYITRDMQELRFLTLGTSHLPPETYSNHYDNAITRAKQTFAKNLVLLDYLLKNGATPETCTTRGGKTPLHVLIGTKDLHHLERGYEEVIERLLKYGAKVDAKDAEGNTPMHAAAKAGDVTALNYLYLQGGDIHATNRDLATPLHVAAENKGPNTCKQLIKLGADPIAKDKNGLTPAARLLAAHQTEFRRYAFRDEDAKKRFEARYEEVHAVLTKTTSIPVVSTIPEVPASQAQPNIHDHTEILAFHPAETPELLRCTIVKKDLSHAMLEKLIRDVFGEKVIIDETVAQLVTDLSTVNMITRLHPTRSLADIYSDMIQAVRHKQEMLVQKKYDVALIKAMLDIEIDGLARFPTIAAALLNRVAIIGKLSEDEIESMLDEPEFAKVLHPAEAKDDNIQEMIDELIDNLTAIHRYANTDQATLRVGKDKTQYTQNQIARLIRNIALTLALEKARDAKQQNIADDHAEPVKTPLVAAMQIAGGNPLIQQSSPSKGKEAEDTFSSRPGR